MSTPLPDGVRGLPWWQHVAVIEEPTGEVVGWYLHEAPEDAPDDVKEGITRRSDALKEGACLCGAALVWATRADGTPNPHVVHRPDCPGHIEVLRAAIAAWDGS